LAFAFDKRCAMIAPFVSGLSIRRLIAGIWALLQLN
jgi:hypothetical protein